MILMPLLFSQDKKIRLCGQALICNIKPYFLLLLFNSKLNSIRYLNYTILSIIIIFFFSSFFFDSSYLVIRNIFYIAESKTIISYQDAINFPLGISSLFYAIRTPEILSLITFLPRHTLGLITGIGDFLIFILSLYAIRLCFQKKIFISEPQSIGLFILIIGNSFFSAEIGAYFFVLYIFLIPIFYKLRYKIIYLLLLGLIYYPIQWKFLYNYSKSPQFSFLAGSIKEVSCNLYVSNLLIPIINLIMFIIFLCEIATLKKLNKNV